MTRSDSPYHDGAPEKEERYASSSSSIEEAEELLPSQHSARSTPRRSRPWLWTSAWALSLLTTSVLTWHLARRPALTLEDFPVVDRIASLSWYSPVHNDIDLHIEHKVVDGELWWNESQPFRQDPSPETDARWEELVGGHANRIFVSKEDWVKMGMDPEVGAQWVGDPTGNTYMAEINVFHLVHCVDMLRQGAFLDYYWYSRPINPLYWSHFYHCLDMVRQELMCLAPLDLSPLVWSEHQKMPFPYFTINRQCRRWEDVVKYRDEHQMTQDQLDLMMNATKPPHQKEMPIPPHAKTLLENIGRWKAKDPAEFEYVKMDDYGRNEWDGLPPVQKNPHGTYAD